MVTLTSISSTRHSWSPGKVIDLLDEEVNHPARIGLHQDQRARAMTVTLYRDGPRAFGRELWEAFLASSNDLMRAKGRLDVGTSVDSFFRTVDALRLSGVPGRVDEILGLLSQARPQADAFRRRLLDNPTMIPVLDPLIPAIVRAVVHWGDGSRPVSIIHDRQNTLSERRIAQLKEIVSKPRPALLGYSYSARLTTLALAD
jgi:hypothetical protein